MFSVEKTQSQFTRDGFVILPRLVDRDDLSTITRAIQADFGDQSTEPTRNLRADNMPSAFRSAAEVVHSAVEQLLGETAPLRECRVSVFHQGEAWNSLDIGGQGRYSEGTTSWKRFCFFRVLAAVYCSDVPGAGFGGLRILRGGHDCIAKWFESFGASFFNSEYEAEKPDELYRTFASGLQFLNPLAQAEPMEAGDVLIAHCLMPHGVDIVQSAEPRRGLYFRFGDPVFTDYRQLSDPWAGWNLQKQ